MKFSKIKKWEDLSLTDRTSAIATIMNECNAAIEVSKLSVGRKSVRVTRKLSQDASIVGRIAWGVWWSSQHLVSSLYHNRRDLYERIPDEGSVLEHLWEGRPPFILWVRDKLRTNDRDERAVITIAENTISAFDAWLEAHYYLEIKKYAITQYLSASSLRVLDTFNPLRRTNRSMPNMILYTGGFETNRRRH